MTVMTVMCDARGTLAPGLAAQELQLKSGEFELADQLGVVRTVAAEPEGRPWSRRVPWEEIERLRAQEGFPDTLRERLRTYGAKQAAERMGIAPSRFVRLARSGAPTPVKFYANRYGAVVWLYLAEELAHFAESEPELMRGKFPTAMRTVLDGGQDWRGRRWRSRRVAQLLARSVGAWESAAVIAAVLPPEEVASVVASPQERSRLRQLRPPSLATVTALTASAREAVDRASTADEFDEVMWYRVNLSRTLEQARGGRAIPPPGDQPAGSVVCARKSPSWTTDTSRLPSRS